MESQGVTLLTKLEFMYGYVGPLKPAEMEIASRPSHHHPTDLINEIEPIWEDPMWADAENDILHII